jgi:hypothetical protein
MRGATLGEPAASADAWKRSLTTCWSRCRARISAAVWESALASRRYTIPSRVSPWDWRPVRPRLADRAAGGRAGADGMGGDDIGFPKEGDHSARCSAHAAARWQDGQLPAWGRSTTGRHERPRRRQHPPMTGQDFIVAPDGTPIPAQFDPAGFWRTF